MHIRQATYNEIDRLMVIFDNAKAIMRNSGNMEQWNGSYPTVEVVSSDIEAGNCFVLCDGEIAGSNQHECEEIIGTMALIPGPDPTYGYIDGQWDNDEPYYVIHRIATYAPGRNTAVKMFDWAFGHIAEKGCRTIRIDTHKDNCIMKHILTGYGFNMCGVIYLADGAARDAYQLTKE